MFVALSRHRSTELITGQDVGREVITTYLAQPEFEALHALYGSPLNMRPQFGMIDLISACIALVARQEYPGDLVILKARSDIALRAPGSRKRCEIWQDQFRFLCEIQRSPANRSPNPKFDLGDLTTACVALVLSAAKTLPGPRIIGMAREMLARRTIGDDDLSQLMQDRH